MKCRIYDAECVAPERCQREDACTAGDTTPDLLQLAREALEDDKRATPGPWRNGRSVGRTLYDANDRLIGCMDSVDDAALIAAARTREPLLAAEVVRLTEENQKLHEHSGVWSESLWRVEHGQLQADRDQLKAECERLKVQSEFCRHVMESLAAQLAAMTAARNALADLLDNAPDPGCSPTFWAKLRAVGGKETT